MKELISNDSYWETLENFCCIGEFTPLLHSIVIAKLRRGWVVETFFVIPSED